MEILGSAWAIVGGSAATGSSRYSFRSSSDIGTDAQKYEKVLLSGIISPRKRSANWPTLSLERSGCADIGWGGIGFILARGRIASFRWEVRLTRAWPVSAESKMKKGLGL